MLFYLVLIFRMGKDDSVIEKQALEAKKAEHQRALLEIDAKRRKILEDINNTNASLEVVNKKLAEKAKFKQDADELQAHKMDLVKQVYNLNLSAEQ